jgi:predicted dehydrogenase
MANELRWGILGTGVIARKFAHGLLESRTGKLVAIGSRTEESALDFAKDFPARVHGSYEALLADPDVDIVYISTPHPMHAEWAIRAAKAGKHLLCEKPLTMNAGEAEEVIEAARAAGVFMMEAFMYRCHPQTAKLVELVRSGAIGRVRLVEAAFAFRADWKPEGRLLNPALGGGAILDVGCYPISFARLIAGAMDGAAYAEPVELKGTGQIGETGVDELATAVLKFPNGMLAKLATGVRLWLPRTATIWGETGRIEVRLPWILDGPAGESLMLIHREDQPVEEVRTVTDRGVYAIEADVVAESIEAGESPAMSWGDSLGNMRALDRWRAEVGLR